MSNIKTELMEQLLNLNYETENEISIKDMNIEIISNKIEEIIDANDKENKYLFDLKKTVYEQDSKRFKLKNIDYAALSEGNFLNKKTLRACELTDEKLIKSEVTDSYYDKEIQGRFDFFINDFSKENDDYFHFKMPLLFTEKAFKKRLSIGNSTKLFMLNMIAKLSELGVINREPFEKATIIYEHHIDVTATPIVCPDSDNLEEKYVTDTLQGIFINNDTLLDINTFHIGKKDTESYTKIHIINQPYFLSWLKNNAELFNEK